MVMLILMSLAAIMIVPAIAADVTIPINQDYKSDNGNSSMIVHLIAVNITTYTMGNEFTKYGSDNTIWPKLLFTYKNVGSSASYSHLQIKFKDDQGNTYSSTDDKMIMLQPGETSEMRFLEVPVQKDRTIKGFDIIEGFKDTYYPIEYQTVPSTTTGPGIPIISNIPFTNLCCTSLLLPLLAIGAIFVSRRKR
jgi:hypothetical protein